ncbi:hypothetical protein WMF31_36820 [Sorangium sp. So ce1036]|uniref:hypothetical protein n=1 Tax=Sorangium sp. So ce1036 TaxID=3133328 RepID=UPI003F036D6A
MREVLDLKAQRKERLLSHPFFDWAHSDAVPLEERLLMAPIMSVFVMNFRDANKWFIRYPRPLNELEAVINGNTLEDETHSALFLENWKTLGLDEHLGWRASDTLWWVFLADETEPFRRFVMDFARMTVEDGGDPLIRFAHSESAEACGNAFFLKISEVASALEQKTGIRHRYFGSHHLDREPGHVLESPGVFDHQELDARQRPLAVELANRMFDIFTEMFTCFLRYSESYVNRGVSPRRPDVAPPSRRPQQAAEGAPALEIEREEPVALYHKDVHSILLEKKAQAARHPFYTWLREVSDISPEHKLQRFIPMWIGDVMGYRELNRYAVRYRTVTTPQEALINRWCDDLETHNGLFLNDWIALGMDEALGWQARETLKFCFLDRDVDVHRRNMCTFVKLAMGNPKPALRYWFLEAMEASGHAFFENVKDLAHVVERQKGIRLDYLGDRHEVAHPVREHRAESRAIITSERITVEERDIAIGMIETIFQALDEQLTLSLEVATSNKFGIGTDAGARIGRPKRTERPSPLLLDTTPNVSRPTKHA